MEFNDFFIDEIIFYREIAMKQLNNKNLLMNLIKEQELKNNLPNKNNILQRRNSIFTPLRKFVKNKDMKFIENIVTDSE